MKKLIKKRVNKMTGETKICSKCNEEKVLTEFHVNRNQCKICRKEYLIKYNESNPNRGKEYYQNNRENFLSYRKKNYAENKEEVKTTTKEYRDNNKETIKIKKKEYFQKNKIEIAKKKRIYMKNKMLTDSLFKLKRGVRCLISNSFKNIGLRKNSRTHIILGCTIEEFKTHIESKFESWMTWDNKGNWNGQPKEINVAWDIDHIIPICNAKTIDDVKRLNHYTNLQPLCSYTNRNLKRAN